MTHFRHPHTKRDGASCERARLRGLACMVLASSAAWSALARPVGAAPVIDIVGWPGTQAWTSATSTPEPETGADPVIGRQACPPLTRFNPATSRQEDIIVRRAVEENRSATGTLWHFELRSGIHWWSGGEVTTADLAAFIKQAVPAGVASRGAGVWNLPEFALQTRPPATVTLMWKQAPEFGPYILNDVAFSRPVSATSGATPGFECAGVYKARLEESGAVLLEGAPGYAKSGALPTLRLSKSPDPKGSTAKNPATAGSFKFRLADTFGGSPAARTSDQTAQCRSVVDLPIATMIVWNLRRPMISDPAFRKIMTQLTPRGVLAIGAAAGLAEIATAPLPKLHPGYDRGLPPRDFDFAAASSELTRIGFKRPTATGPRLGPDGKPIKLTIKTAGAGAGLLEKVIVDAFTSVGIELEVTAENRPMEAIDGYLGAFTLDWPGANLMPELHSAAKAPSPFMPLMDPQLDKAMVAWASSMTTAAPDIQLLAEVHRRLYDLEPVTVILQHKACLEASGPMGRSLGKLDARDPDWFRKLLR